MGWSNDKKKWKRKKNVEHFIFFEVRAEKKFLKQC